MVENFSFKCWCPAYLNDPSTVAILKPSRISCSCSHPSSPRLLPGFKGKESTFKRCTQAVLRNLVRDFYLYLFKLKKNNISNFYIKPWRQRCRFQLSESKSYLTEALHNIWRQTKAFAIQNVYEKLPASSVSSC